MSRPDWPRDHLSMVLEVVLGQKYCEVLVAEQSALKVSWQKRLVEKWYYSQQGNGSAVTGPTPQLGPPALVSFDTGGKVLKPPMRSMQLRWRKKCDNGEIGHLHSRIY